MDEYTYDPTRMEALFDEMTSEDGIYGYSGSWETMYVKNQGTGQLEHVENPRHETFIMGDVSFYWYHSANKKHPATPSLVASWSSNYRGDDWDEHELEISAAAEDIERAIRIAQSGDSDYLYDGPDTLEEARGEK